MLPAIYHDIILEFLKNKKLAAIFVMYFIAISFLFVQITHAFFTDSATSTNNTFTAAATFPPLTSAQLKINEVSSDGAALLEWIEIFNPTASSVDVSGWIVLDNNTFDTLPSVTPIPPGGYAVVVPEGSSVIIPGSAVTITLSTPTIGNGLADAGDKVILQNAAATEIDKMSYGSDTTAFPTPPAAPGSGKSLSRSPNGFDTDGASDWIIDSTPSIGISN